MTDLIDDIFTINARKDVKLILAQMAPDKDYKKLVIPFENCNVIIFYSVDENGKKCWEQSLRSPGPRKSETGEANDVLPNRSSTSPRTS